MNCLILTSQVSSIRSCLNQPLSIYHEFFSNFDCDPPKDICPVFLDISKAFDKIWLPGLIFKTKSFGILGDLLEFIKDFLSNRFQRVALNGQISEWEHIGMYLDENLDYNTHIKEKLSKVCKGIGLLTNISGKTIC